MRKGSLQDFNVTTPEAPGESACIRLLGLIGMTGFLCAVATAQTTTQPTSLVPSDLELETVRALPVQHNGREMPLDTLARDLVESITGTTHYQSADPVVMLLSWTFHADAWMDRPLIEVGSAELRAELELPSDKETFSYDELMNHRRLMMLISDLAQGAEGRKLNPLESKVGDLNEKLSILQRVFGGTAIRLIPAANERTAPWRSVGSVQVGQDENLQAVKTAWERLRETFRGDQPKAFNEAASDLKSALSELPAAYRPSNERIATELHYNSFQPWRRAWQVLLVGAVLAGIALMTGYRWLDVLAVIILLGGFVILSYGLYLRWQVAGRLPAANMFESLLFLSWGAAGFGIFALIIMRDRIVPFTASALGAVALLLADVLPMDSFVRPAAPVLLDTIWMSIHVPEIMVSYAVLALAAIIAHVQLVIMAAVPTNRQLINKIDRLHYWYIHVGSILLGIGIITGSMWAASSWGRYWGWDPKEVWSLVAFVAYIAILHVRIDRERMPVWGYGVSLVLGVAVFAVVGSLLAPLTPGMLLGLIASAIVVAIFVLTEGQFATALKSTLAFWLLIMTYIGVNYVLGIGLHSYGFGTGAVVRYMYLVGGIDLAIIGVCTIVYLVRRDGGGTSPRVSNSVAST